MPGFGAVLCWGSICWWFASGGKPTEPTRIRSKVASSIS